MNLYIPFLLGKQFRALFVSTVRTLHSSQESRIVDDSSTQNPYLYFLSDPKLLNTALTRAQSLIAVVGDPFSLRTMGNCQGLWEEFIKRCSDDGNLFGIEHTELEESISQSGLNINAFEFVPTKTAATILLQSSKDASDSSSSSFSLENCLDTPLEIEDNSSPVNEASRFSQIRDLSEDTKHHVLDQSALDSTDASDELSENDGNADDFAEFDYVDETVPPKSMDPIIQALKKKCEEKALNQKLKAKAKSEENTEETRKLDSGTEQDVDELELHDVQKQNMNNTTTGTKIVHGDFKITTKRGKVNISLVNMKYKYSERTERLISQRNPHDQERLQTEYLDRLLDKDPEHYRECTLRVNFDRERTAYGVLRDSDSEDIILEGNTRQSFDRDVIVVKLLEKPCNNGEEPQGSAELKGSVCGIRHHAINLRERQFVCTMSRENPRLMFPINKSMAPIANLNDESIRGVPIYKRIQADEKAVRVKVLPLKEALSGKHYFVVQYLQWRCEFPYPLGIVTKTIPGGKNLTDAFKLLQNEYNLKEDFPEEVTKEVERHTRDWSNIPFYEKKSRRRVLNAFTVDPPGSKALDDALTLEELENGLYKVGIHIADVSYFVKEGSKIDQEAQKRGLSHLKGHRDGEVLMLPRELSHSICSLLPKQDRLAISIFITLDQEGRVEDERTLDFYRTIVTSQCRLTYTQAQRIILGESVHCSSGDGELTLEIEESIRDLSLLAQKRRRIRLSDASFFHFEHPERKQDFEAHEMVEEMMILTNTAVAKYLLTEKPGLSPLRIQLPPKRRKLQEWRENFGDFAKFSLSLSKHLTSTQDADSMQSFVMPKSTWSDIRNKRRRRNKRDLKLLLCNDNVYPQLAVAHSFLNDVASKAEDVRAAEVEEEHRVHWSLNVRGYTRFTSPIRRYLDILAHRLLLNEPASQDPAVDEVAQVVRRCGYLSDRSTAFEKDCGRVQVAEKLKIATCEFTAVVEKIGEDFLSLHLMSEVHQYLSPKQRKIKISHLGPVEQPQLGESFQTVELKWKLRMYDASAKNVERSKRLSSNAQDRNLRQDWKKILSLLCERSTCNSYNIPGGLWHRVLHAIKKDDDKGLNASLEEIDVLITSFEKERITENTWCEEVDRGDYEYVTDSDNDNAVDDDEEEEDDDDDDDDDDDGHDNGDTDEESDFDKEYENSDDDNEDSDNELDCEEQNKKKDKTTKDNQERGERKTLAATSNNEIENVHFVETSLVLQVGDSVSIQLSASNAEAFISPEVQCFNLSPDINICLEHRKLADKCFVTAASGKDSQQCYKSINAYVYDWKPVVAMEAATVAVKNDDTFTLQNLEVKWREDESGKFVGEFRLEEKYCKTRQIEISSGDYACVRFACQKSCSRALQCPSRFSENELSTSSEYRGECGKNDDVWEEIESNQASRKTCWVGHCNIVVSGSQPMNFALKLFQHSMEFPDLLENRNSWICTVEIIKQTIPFRLLLLACNQ